MSAAQMAESASGSAEAGAGTKSTRVMRQLFFFLYSNIFDSPQTVCPFSNSAVRCTLAFVTGSTRPVMAKTSLIRVTACSKLEEMPLRAAKNRLPKDWPLRLPSGNR